MQMVMKKSHIAAEFAMQNLNTGSPSPTRAHHDRSHIAAELVMLENPIFIFLNIYIASLFFEHTICVIIFTNRKLNQSLPASTPQIWILHNSEHKFLKFTKVSERERIQSLLMLEVLKRSSSCEGSEK